MQYKLVIFDLDGTILDTLEDLAVSLNHVLTDAGLPPRTIDEVRQFVGNGIRKLIERAVPTGTETAVIDAVYAAFQADYQKGCTAHTRPYDGIVPLMQQLHAAGVKLAVVTNKADAPAQVLCRQFFPGLLDLAFGERAGVPRKPAPNAVHEVLCRLEIPANRAVFIGDSDVDIRTAENAGMDCIGVSWGFRGRTFLAMHGADRIADTAEELGRMLME